MFLNLSNHPAANWPPVQRAEAEALGGEIVDEAFPLVPPEASCEEVVALAEAALQHIVARPPNAAMVQGEFTLAFYLVHALESRGIACYAATAQRVVEIAALGGGGSERRSRFEFVRFRRYVIAALPAPAPHAP